MIKILAMVVIQRQDWVRPGSVSHYTSYKTPSKSRSGRHSAISRQTELEDSGDRDMDVEMKQVKYEHGAHDFLERPLPS